MDLIERARAAQERKDLEEVAHRLAVFTDHAYKLRAALTTQFGYGVGRMEIVREGSLAVFNDTEAQVRFTWLLQYGVAVETGRCNGKEWTCCADLAALNKILEARKPRRRRWFFLWLY